MTKREIFGGIVMGAVAGIVAGVTAGLVAGATMRYSYDKLVQERQMHKRLKSRYRIGSYHRYERYSP